MRDRVTKALVKVASAALVIAAAACAPNVPPTQTPVPPTQTPVPTETAAAPTRTRIAPSNTPTQPMPTRRPTLTPFPTQEIIAMIASITPIRPTATITSTVPSLTPSITPVPSETPIPPSATPRPTLFAPVGGDAYQAVVMADHPVGYWRMYETSGTVASDFSGGDHAGAYSGDVKLADRQSAYGRVAAPFFNVSGSMATPAGAPTGKSARTVELWYWQADGANRTMLAYGVPDGGHLWEVMILAGRLTLHYWGGQVSTPQATSVNCWHHAVITYDGAGVLQIYLDGILTIAAPNINLDTTAGPLTVGGYASLKSVAPWVGSLSEVSVYDHVLAADRIDEHYRVGLNISETPTIRNLADGYGNAVLAAKPVAYWRLNEKNSATAIDLGKGRQIGSYAGAEGSFTQGLPGALASVPGNTAVQFSGAAQINVCGRGLMPISAQPRTTEIWFNSADGANHTLFAYGAREGSQLWELMQYSGELALHYWGNQVLVGAHVSPNIWHQGVVTYDGSGTVQIYLDGKLIGAGGAGVLQTQWSFIAIGGGGYMTPWVGSLDEVAVYDYVLSADVIAQHYKLATQPPPPSMWF